YSQWKEEMDGDKDHGGAPDRPLELREGPLVERPQQPERDQGIGDELAEGAGGRARVEPPDGGTGPEAECRIGIVTTGRGHNGEDAEGKQDRAGVVGAQPHHAKAAPVRAARSASGGG